MPPRSTLVRFVAAALAVVLSASGGPLRAQVSLRRVSVDSLGIEGDGSSGELPPAISADGRHVAFTSAATNLVANDSNRRLDVFVHDRLTRTTTRVSLSSTGEEGDGDSLQPSISADGRFVAFHSAAKNLVAVDRNDSDDVFVHDRDPGGDGVFDEGDGTTVRVSVDSAEREGDGDSSNASISSDGSRVAFQSAASNLVSGDAGGQLDVFVRDLAAGTTVRVSVDSAGGEGNGASQAAFLSGDGQVVAYQSFASDLVLGDRNGTADAFVHELATGATIRVSVDSAGNEGNALSMSPFLSNDGAWVAFSSNSSNLAPGDANHGRTDVFLHERATGATTRVSVGWDGAGADDSAAAASISADGGAVAFVSEAHGLTLDDTNDSFDVFVRDLVSGETKLVSQSCGHVSVSPSFGGSLSADGTLVAFWSYASDLVAQDENDVPDVFVRDRSVIEPDASQREYGVGFAGELGIPTLVASAAPVLGTTITLVIGNSSSDYTVGFLFVGASEGSTPTSLGGTLLVDVLVLILAVPLSPVETWLPADLPIDPEMCGLAAYLQVLELDPAAAHGVSFSTGLELTFGR